MDRTHVLGRNPRTAVIWAALAGDLARGALEVVDAGGGTGGFAVPLAASGHRVTVVDPSPDALAALTRRAADAGVADRITPIQGDADRLAEFVPPGRCDLVLCHSVLELVDDPAGVAAALYAALRPGGATSTRRCCPGRWPGSFRRPARCWPVPPAVPARASGCAGGTPPNRRNGCWPVPGWWSSRSTGYG